MNNNVENYTLLNSGNNLNYNNSNYNNYQSWSNVGRGQIKISSIDESGNTQTVNQDTSRLQRLSTPYSTFADVELSWVNNSKN
mgnify:CR=1 FL=1|tara:strand:- start:88 stop:336 length:249 start_codon:yes stop_codon:yes gene_type:complete